MARKNNQRHEYDSGDDRLLFENVELKDRIARGSSDLRRLEMKVERLTRAGDKMYDALLHKVVLPHIVADWEAAVK
jgi:hypothetical protein